jgi:orotate phosphoribosyltransferase
MKSRIVKTIASYEELDRGRSQGYNSGTMEKRNITQLKTDLLALLKKEAFKKGKFVLSSGKESNFYLDGRIITMLPEGAYLTGLIILDMIKDDAIDAFGGPTLGADPIVGAVAALAYMNQRKLQTFIVRKSAKEHGTQRQVEGPALKAGMKVILVDDVATSGKSLIEAKAVLDAMQVRIERAIVIVDRSEGAQENLRQAGIKLQSIFTIADLGV